MASSALSDLTTFRTGGPIGTLVEARTPAEAVACAQRCDAAGEPLLILGGGSNIVAPDEGFPGTVLLLRNRGIEVLREDAEAVQLRVSAGEPWDGFVALAVDAGWAGVEAMSGIPGMVGAAPIQNIGAYGQDVARVIESVDVYDRIDRTAVVMEASSCDFAYRSSRFKSDPDRFLVTAVTCRLLKGSTGGVVAYPELARRLGVQTGDVAPLADVRRAVLELRRSKGMVLDPADHDSWSAGSFFTNPILDEPQADSLPADAPRYPAGGGRVKSSAAWLIEHAGFPKGFRLRPDSAAAISSKHTLAMTNRGGATTSDILELARAVRDGVEAAFGIRLENEPVILAGSL